MATTARSRKKTRLRGRSLVALGLLVFVAVAALVVWRRSVGVSTANQMVAMQAEKRTLQSERVALERDIREAQSRLRVVTEAERRLGLHVAPDSQSRIIADPSRTP